jgi:pSer/pThr/pTyr-binding forkhead associated (FHA) protein
MIGWVEMLTKDAWLLMTAGPLTGKQFIVCNNPTLIGSSPKCEVYLFKDPEIEAFHAAIHRMRDAYEIEDRGTATGTLVNGERITRRRLVSGDEIRIGRTAFTYSEKPKRRAGAAA